MYISNVWMLSAEVGVAGDVIAHYYVSEVRVNRLILENVQMNISAVLDDFFCKESLGLDKIKYSHVNLNKKETS